MNQRYRGFDFTNKQLQQAIEIARRNRKYAKLFVGSIIALFLGLAIFFISLIAEGLFFPYADAPVLDKLIMIGFTISFAGIMGMTALVVIGIVTAIGRSQNSLVHRWEAGVQGERAVETILSGFLGDDWALFSGVEAPGAWGDIDHVLVGPPGVFAIEVKNWSGKVEYRDDEGKWVRTNSRVPQGEVVKDPAEQVLQGAYALQGVLGVEVTPVVVFSHPKSEVVGDHPKVQVLALKDLKAWLLSRPATLNEARLKGLVAEMKKLVKPGEQE